jgi:Mg-chelatase subunit ChlD
MALLADLTGATDQRLRDQARRLAAKLFVDIGQRGPAPRRGVGAMRTTRYRPGTGDLDLDASLDALASRHRSAIDADELRIRDWVKPGVAWCLLVDRSGSMGGKPLATAAVAAAAVAARVPDDFSVVAFSWDLIVLKGQTQPKPVDLVINDLLSLRGYGTTDVAGALGIAADQLARSRAARKVTILLSDCRATNSPDPVPRARMLDELVVIAPADGAEEALRFAAASGARCATVDGPGSFVAALSSVL